MVFLTTIAGFFLLNLKNNNNQLLIVILSTSSLNEIITLLLEYSNQQKYIGTLYSISFPMFCVFWMILLYKNQFNKKTTLFFLGLFFSFVVINFFCFQGTDNFNYYSAVIGSFIYVGLLANESFIQLKNENFNFIFSNRYLLLLAPVLMFFGFGLMFGFVSRQITQTVVISDYNLFEIVTNFVNLTYYLMLLIYIFLEKKQIKYE